MRMKKIILIIILIFICIFGYFKFVHKNAVITSSNHITSQIASSLGASEYSKNLNDLIGIVNNQDPRAALQELSRRMQTNQVVFQNCHVMAHTIGRTAYKKYNDFDIALKYQDTTCSDGYLHGVIEARFASLADDFNATINELKTMCSKYTYADRCWHGTGHGLMFYTGNNLPKALSLCNTYSSSRAQRRCYEGVFMENFLSDPDAHPTAYADAKYPFKPCMAQSGRYKATCYFYVPIYYLGLHANDYKEAVQWCEGAESGYSDACVKGVGSLAMKYNIDDPKYVESLCSVANPDDIPSCIDGMVSYYLTFTGNLSKTAQLCTQLEAGNIPSCRAAVKRNIALFQN